MGKGIRYESAEVWTLRIPVSDAEVDRFEVSMRVCNLNGKIVGLFWNGKPNGDIFLNEVGAELQARFKGLQIVRFWESKPETRTALGNSSDHLKYMSRAADLIIASSGD